MSASPPIVNTAITTLSGGIRVTNAPWITTGGSPVNAIFQKDQTVLIGQRPETSTGPFKHCVRIKLSDVTMENPTSGAKSYVMLWANPGTNYDANPPSGLYSSFLPPGGYDAGKTYVMPAGGGLATQTYSVNASNQLTLNGTAVAEGVISMQVQYGIGNASVAGKACTGDGSLNDGSSDPRCQQVVGWTDAIPAGFDGVDWSALSDMSTAAAHATTLTNIRRIKAVRIAIVTRSANLERNSLYAATGPDAAPIPPKPRCDASGDIVDGGGGAIRICAWRDPTRATPPAVPTIDPSLAADEATCAGALGASCWDRYRYRVYETIVPLRNIIWGTATN
jgi:type IV pilus assembly protein PilW